MTIPPLGLQRQGQISKKGQIFNSCGEKTINAWLYDVHELFNPYTKILKFMAHGSVVQTVGWADIAIIVKMY